MSTVYCLHGLLGTALAHCGFQIRAWQHYYTVIVFDLPGHGRASTDALKPYFPTSLEQFRQRLERFGPGHILGVSYLGGSIAVRAALKFPHLIHSLTLSGFVPDVPENVFIGWVQGFARLAERNDFLVQQYKVIHGDRWRSTLEIIAKECEEEYSSINVTRSMVSELKVPTLIINGEIKSDERAAARDLPLCNPLIEGIVIPEAGHIAGYDQPELFNSIVQKFWEKIDGSKLPVT